MTDELKPIIGAHNSPSQKGDADFREPVLSLRLRLLTHAVRLSSAFAAIGAFIVATYYFIGFVENDERTAHLINAFVICYGIGALIVGPAFYMARKAHFVLRDGPIKGISFGTFALMFPWVIVGFYFQMLQGLWNVIGSLMIVFVFEYVWWAAELYKAARSHRP